MTEKKTTEQDEPKTTNKPQAGQNSWTSPRGWPDEWTENPIDTLAQKPSPKNPTKL